MIIVYVQVSVTDLLGKSIGPGIKVVADSVIREADDSKLAASVQLTPIKNYKSEYRHTCGSSL